LEISNPLLEPQRISGSFRQAQKEMRTNLDGKQLVYSSGQPITGPLVMMDYAAPSVHVEQNVGSLALNTITTMVNTVNDRTIWGVPARFMKLTGVSWERKIYGRCGYYYTRSFDFEVNNFTVDKNGDLIGWDKEIYDSSTQILTGHWYTQAQLANGDADPDYGKYIIDGNTYKTVNYWTPRTRYEVGDTVQVESHSNAFYTCTYGHTSGSTFSSSFWSMESPSGIANVLSIPQKDVIAYRDMNGAYTRCYLDGHGLPANTQWKQVDKDGTVLQSGTSGDPATGLLQFNRESNFLLLGIPTVL